MATAKYTRGKDGYFSTKIWDGTYNADGTKHRKPLRSKKSSRDLENQVKAFERDVEERKAIIKTDIGLWDYAKSWKNVYKKQRENNTKSMYDNIIDKHFKVLDGVKLQDTAKIHLQIMLNNATGMTRTQDQIYMTFKQVLKSAVYDHLFPANVMEDIFEQIEPIDYNPPEKRPLTKEETAAVFAADLKEQDKVMLYIFYGCGLRREENLALTRFNVNLNKKELSVTRAYEYTTGQAQEKGPKSNNGYRVVPIPDIIFPTVERFVKSIDRTNLFVMRGGKPMSKSSYDKAWGRIRKALSVVLKEETDLTAHVFRHNYCTNLCYQIPTISIKRIAQLMGDTEKMVIDVYNHIILEKEDAAKAVNDAFKSGT
ncbi:MAG: tyrosine-type recombinase/integrase [Muricomes sp.]